MVDSQDMRHVYMYALYVCVCASRADEMKTGGHLNYMCQQNTNPNNKEGLHMYSSLAGLHVSLTRPRLSPSLADTPCTISHGSDVLL